jgi:predicted CXXCH cytochrome family protein
VPKALVDAGAQLFGKPAELTCLVCHSTHSSTHKPLLIMPADTNQLCLACHEKEMAELAPGGKLPRHSQGPRLTPAQRAVVEGRGGRTGPNGELLCVSCHKVHHAEPDAKLLAFRPKSEDACSACHPGQAGVVGTVHDLRTNFPDDRNLAGDTPRDAGPCSGCHTAHRPARTPVAGPADAQGLCTTCHRADGCAKGKLAGNEGHAGHGCLACHNPHDSGQHGFLAKSPADLCKGCHAELYAVTGGPHDRTRRPGAWPKSSGTQGPCEACHKAHGPKGSGLFRFDVAADGNHDAACLACHADAAWGAHTGTAAIHPQKISSDEKRVPLALVPTDAAGNLRMGCRTCHNPHAGADPAHLARVKPGEPTAGLCTHCHEEKKLIEMTGHATPRLAKLGLEVDSCKPCHAMHANPDGAWGQMLSPRFLVKVQQTATRPAEASLPCLACHHANGPAPIREIATHPPVSMINTIRPDQPGYMPLFNDSGKVDEHGQITCRTCHLSHGQTDLLKAAAADSAQASPDEKRSARMQLRPFAAPNLCTQCHGDQARLKFLFFHNVAQRTGK